jgi:hypothetical protein
LALSEGETSVRIKERTMKVLVQAIGKMEQRDGKKRTLDKGIYELAEKELTRLFD